MSAVPSFAQLKEIIKSIGITMSRQIAQLGRRIDNLPNKPIDAVTLNSATENSNKRFKITVDDTGTISATEITE